ncbi:Isochorismatase family protein [Roseibium album]|nr:Isochorismatase family protein [Roseibium album]
MPGIWSAVGIVCLGVLGLVLYFGYFLKKLSTPTKGALIDARSRPNSALIVIDVQEDFTRNTGKQAFDPIVRDAALAAINLEIETARSLGTDVVFIKNVFRDWPVIVTMKLLAKGIGTPGRVGLRIDGVLDVGNAPIFEKSIGDTFSNPEFEAFLADRKIGRLRLVGLDACHCVQLTARGALSRGYQVEIAEPSVLTATPQKWPPLKQQLDAAGVAFA